MAIEILPESQWAAPSSLVLEEKDEELAEEEQEKNVIIILHFNARNVALSQKFKGITKENYRSFVSILLKCLIN